MFLRILSLSFLLSLSGYISAESVEDISNINNHCDKISGKLASVRYRECLTHKFKKTEGYSINGSPIIIKNIHPESDADKMVEDRHQRVLIVGGFHGNEFSSVSVIFKWITLIDQYYTGLYHWQIIPLLNPDGLLQTSPERTNANGVDLDRNFPVSTKDFNANQYWKENANSDPDYFPGEYPLSEPESQWLATEIEQYQPDAIITVHAPNNSLSYKSANDKQLINGAQYQQSIATYPGSFNQYVGAELNIPILTVELPYADIMLAKTEINETLKNLIEWLKNNIESS